MKLNQGNAPPRDSVQDDAIFQLRAGRIKEKTKHKTRPERDEAGKLVGEIAAFVVFGIIKAKTGSNTSLRILLLTTNGPVDVTVFILSIYD